MLDTLWRETSKRSSDPEEIAELLLWEGVVCKKETTDGYEVANPLIRDYLTYKNSLLKIGDPGFYTLVSQDWKAGMWVLDWLAAKGEDHILKSIILEFIDKSAAISDFDYASYLSLYQLIGTLPVDKLYDDDLQRVTRELVNRVELERYKVLRNTKEHNQLEQLQFSRFLRSSPD